MGKKGGSSDERETEEESRTAPTADTMPPDGSYSEQLREMILEATSRIVEDEGVQAATPTRIFAATGIARSTIYRHWPSKVELLDEALRRRSIKKEKDHSQLSDLERMVRQTIDRIQDDSFIRMLATILGYADVGDHDDNAKWRKLATDLVRSKSEEFHSYLAKAKEEGRIYTDLSSEEVAALALGPILYLRFLTRDTVSDEVIHELVKVVRGHVKESTVQTGTGEAKK